MDRTAVVILHTPNTIAPGAWNSGQDVAAYAQAVRELAERTGAILVDHHAHWSSRFPDGPAWEWLDDPVHPNGAGHAQMAQTTFAALGIG